MSGLGEARGLLVLVGGGEWHAPDEVVAEIAAAAGDEILVVPTAAAFERPERAVESAARAFADHGVRVVAADILTRRDAQDPAAVARVRGARATLFVGSSPLHLRSVLKDSAVFHALIAAWNEGAVVVGAGEAATAFTDPMVDPRGGAFTVGLGLVRDLAVVPNHRDDGSAQFRRTLALAPSECALVGLASSTALFRDPDGVWRAVGEPAPAVYVAGASDALSSLAGKPTA